MLNNMSIDRNAILNEKKNSDGISPDIIKKISIILKYVETAKSTVFNKKAIVGLLNKLSDKNKMVIFEQIMELLENKDDLEKYLEEMFSHIFNNSIKQSQFIEIYIELIGTLNQKYPQLILNHLNSKIDLFINTIRNISNKTKDINIENYDDLCVKFKNIQYINGYSKFIAGLYNYGLYQNIIDISTQLMDIILNDTDIETKKNLIDGLFNIMTSINLIKITSSNKELLIEKSKQLQDIDITKKSKFQLMDIVDYLSK